MDVRQDIDHELWGACRVVNIILIKTNLQRYGGKTLLGQPLEKIPLQTQDKKNCIPTSMCDNTNNFFVNQFDCWIQIFWHKIN